MRWTPIPHTRSATRIDTLNTVAHAMAKLTPEDVTWLEQRLSDAIEPVAPRPEFVRRAKQELMGLPPVRSQPSWVKPSILAAVVLSLLSLIAALFYLRRRS